MPIPDYGSVVLLLPMSGTNNGTVFNDWSSNIHAITRLGSTKTSTTQSKYYGSSGYFNGTTDYLTCNTVCALLAGTNTEFTIQGWFFREADNTGQDTLFGFHNSTGATNKAVFTATQFFGSTGATTNLSTEVPIGSWFHFAAVRSLTNWKAYLNGAEILNITESANNDIASGDLFSIGQEYDSGPVASDYWKGYINDFVISLGAMYSSAFTPPEKLIGSISGVIKDAEGSNAIRNVITVPRSSPSRTFHTTSAADGTYSISVPNTECSVLVLDDAAGTLFNDRVIRVIPG